MSPKDVSVVYNHRQHFVTLLFSALYKYSLCTYVCLCMWQGSSRSQRTVKEGQH